MSSEESNKSIWERGLDEAQMKSEALSFAQDMRIMYNAFQQVGFDAKQSLVLVINMINAMARTFRGGKNE